MNEQRLNEIGAWVAQATPGPWEYDGHEFVNGADFSTIVEIETLHPKAQNDANGYLIAAAWELYHALADAQAEVARLRAALRRIERKSSPDMSVHWSLDRIAMEAFIALYPEHEAELRAALAADARGEVG